MQKSNNNCTFTEYARLTLFVFVFEVKIYIERMRRGRGDGGYGKIMKTFGAKSIIDPFQIEKLVAYKM